MKIAVIDYGSGNLRSVGKAFERAAADMGLDASVTVTADADAVAAADRVVLPGVGAFADCLAGLDALPGMRETLERVVIADGRPFFGICVGLQLMAARGHEYGQHQGLGWIDGDVVHLEPADPALKIPHMGWNELVVDRGHPLLDGLPEKPHCYFVHSYQFRAADPAHLVAHADYGGPVTAVVGRDNLVGTQFHPEKSQKTGIAVIANFLRWRP